MNTPSIPPHIQNSLNNSDSTSGNALELTWKLVDEIGIETGPSPVPTTSLAFPVFAEKAADGTYLINDELGTEKIVPFRFESRTIRVDNQGEIVFDTLPLGIDDGVGCLLDNGDMAIFRRCKWELVVVSLEGLIKARLPLSSLSKRMPRYVSRTERGTFLIVFCNSVKQVDIIEVDRHGRLLWFLPPETVEIGIAGSVEWLPADTFLIADPFRHVVTEIDRSGNIVWQFGKAGEPSNAASCLSSPNSARVLPDGRRIIADMRNHRVLVVAPNGTTTELGLENGAFCDPMYATPLRNGNILVCDTGNQRVLETDETGRIVWQLGNDAPQRRMLSYPRSVELSDDQKIVVADTARDRIMEFAAGQVRERPVQIEPPIFWPRCARSLPSGGLLIADGRNGRVLEVAANGKVVKSLSEIVLGGGQPLRDPHDVRQLPNGHLLIVDSSQDLVVEADWAGQVYRTVGESGGLELNDPHSAQQMDDGTVLIADTGHHRILIVGPDGKLVRKIFAIHADSSCYRLNFPRYVEIIEDGTMVIADTGNNRVLAATIDGNFIWEFSRVPGTRLSRLNQPRWAKLIGRYEVLICDHLHHRILHFKCDDSEGINS